MKKFRIPVLVAVVLALSAATFFLTSRPEPVPAVTLAGEEYSLRLTGTGRITARTRLEVTAEISGTVAEVQVREGDTVEAGQVLVVLDDRDALLALSQAEAALSEAQARLDSLRKTQAPVSAQSVAQLEISLADAERALERQETLYAEGAVSLAQLEAARSQRNLAASQLSAARTGLSAQQGGGTQERELASGVRSARVQVESARQQMEKLVIRAPFSGEVSSLEVIPGEALGFGAPVLVLTDPESFYVEVDMDQQYAGVIRPGQPALIRPEGGTAGDLTGEVLALGRSVDPAGKTVPVELTLPEGALRLQDLGVRTEIEVTRVPDALLVPVRYLAGENPYRVLVAEDGTVRERTFSGEPGDLTRVLVREGLAAGMVLIDPQSGLRDGDPAGSLQMEE